MAQQRYPNGTDVRDTEVEVFSHTPFSGQTNSMPFVEVDCQGNSSLFRPCGGFLTQLQGGHCGKRKLDLQGPCLQNPVGAIELSLEQNPHLSVRVQYQSSSPTRNFVSSSLWLGPDLTKLPRLADSGMPDLSAFPFFSSLSSGYDSIVFEQPLTVDCEDDKEVRLYGVAHAISQEFSPGGRALNGTRETSYGYMSDYYVANQWFGYFVVVVECVCAREAFDFDNTPV